MKEVLEMELIPKKGINLEEGKYNGVITRIEYRTEPYKYTDIIIEVENKNGLELKYGAPTSEGMDGKLMKLLSKFTEIKQGVPVDPEKVLISQQVTFMVMNEEKGDKTFVKIVDNSVKPKPKEVTEESVKAQ